MQKLERSKIGWVQQRKLEAGGDQQAATEILQFKEKAVALHLS